MVVHPSSNHQSRTQQCSQFRFVLFNVNRQSQGESYQNFNAYKFTNKTHTDECYADISHYLQKNVSASLNSTTQNCVEALFGMWLLFASPVFRQCPKSPPTEHVNLSPSKWWSNSRAYHRTAELPTCHRRRKTVIADWDLLVNKLVCKVVRSAR